MINQSWKTWQVISFDPSTQNIELSATKENGTGEQSTTKPGPSCVETSRWMASLAVAALLLKFCKQRVEPKDGILP